ncbi:MAG: hypothetical protein CVT98_08940 [Bacteroidetes bacterium HGW-Bacteroidetes-15]|nr:MAG: hypothetical protein CVT98_08940 [Bacteroidetes bacterium HGW-Bacteroidetes-15]
MLLAFEKVKKFLSYFAVFHLFIFLFFVTNTLIFFYSCIRGYFSFATNALMFFLLGQGDMYSHIVYFQKSL